MSIPNYGKKLIKDGVLIVEPRLIHSHDFQQIWSPDFMESIVFISAAKDKYTSSLNFFWQSIFHLREVTNQAQAEEIFTSTHLYKVTLEQAKEKIKHTTPKWFDDHKELIPNAKWSHIIWNDSNDVFITFEDEEMYYGWGWDCTL
ncbi:MAG: hypothetical protein L3J83_06040, partial [Proteobacteria bacterium]|nr:hypothetical protein [Pseudomonadota bacterium]